mmetsp:Transcript_5682/g.17702  ORF Transcript_5682/g.17702 Transcript_5682/m.17702 type:complete len:170 (+) Transcript_5682:62-571(+)|eukprot:scaffold179578_cov34-Tisochrysis_lutea.AAC.1
MVASSDEQRGSPLSVLDTQFQFSAFIFRTSLSPPSRHSASALAISKRAGSHAAACPPRRTCSLGQSLVGKRIAVPYNFVISDDYSGCYADAIVLAVSPRGCLVELAGERQWRSEAFVRQWMIEEDQLVCAFDGLATSTTNSSTASPECARSTCLTYVVSMNDCVHDSQT